MNEHEHAASGRIAARDAVVLRVVLVQRLDPEAIDLAREAALAVPGVDDGVLRAIDRELRLRDQLTARVLG